LDFEKQKLVVKFNTEINFKKIKKYLGSGTNEEILTFDFNLAKVD